LFFFYTVIIIFADKEEGLVDIDTKFASPSASKRLGTRNLKKGRSVRNFPSIVDMKAFLLY